MHEPDVFQGAGWELLDDAVDQEATNRAARGGSESLSLRLGPGGRALLKEAARRRGISMDGYLRRAVMGRICADLGLDWHVVMADEPVTTGFGGDPHSGRLLAGIGFGAWDL